MNLKPLGDNLVIEVSEEKVTKSGIVIPDTASKEKPTHGKVVAVGPGKWNEDGDKRIPMSVKVGDTVVFEKYGVNEIEVEGKKFLVVEEKNVMAIVE